jgi:hypothetical protein
VFSAAQFREQLASLMQNIGLTSVQYVRCVKVPSSCSTTAAALTLRALRQGTLL